MLTMATSHVIVLLEGKELRLKRESGAEGKSRLNLALENDGTGPCRALCEPLGRCHQVTQHK
jgi:hypothetical protein